MNLEDLPDRADKFYAGIFILDPAKTEKQLWISK